MSTFILVHGSLLGGWCWKKVKPILEKQGNTVITPDLPGHSLHPRIPASQISMNKYISSVCDLIESTEGQVILVGHSLGGAVITAAAETAYHLISKLVYVCAVIPEHGERVGEILDRDSGAGPENGITVNKEKMCLELDKKVLDRTLMNGCDKEDISFAKRHVVPQPLLPFTEPISLEKEHYRKVDRTGIVCTQDRSLSPTIQQKMYERAGCRIKFLDSGHAPYFSRAEELSEILIDCCTS